MKRIEVVKGEYYDSVTLMMVAKELKKIQGVGDAALNMATEANVSIMRAAGFEVETDSLSPDDLLIGIDFEGEGIEKLFDTARSYLARPPWRKEEIEAEYSPVTLSGALTVLPESNLALISLPGRYAAAEAMKALK
ncbi:MAG TPA: fatty-acid metabolism regulator protein, partial [Mesotoga infera]|nr:fatty-acid metabolism regulator protein [Mesotoga infera]